MNKIPIALFGSREAAEPIQRRLSQAGFEASIHEEQWFQRLWYVPKAGAGATLEVAADQFERAEAVLLGWDAAEGALREAIHCPECKSLLVDYPQFARNSVMTNMALGLLAEVGLVEKDYYCEHCHFTWPKQRTKPARARTHMAPYYFIEGGLPSGLPSAGREGAKAKV
jgi:hypothetical protein